MKIETIEISKINPAVYNPRKDLKTGDPEYEHLKKSINEFGLIDPLIWNKRTGNLVGGHQRLKILKGQGIKCVEVSVVDFDDVKEKALNIALNKISGDWDMPLLKDLLEELDTGDFDMDLTGFTSKEIEDLMNQCFVPEEGLTDDDAIPENAETICKKGDLWKLGEHRLLCGDSTVITDVERLMQGEKADMVFTDPPYLMDFTGSIRADGSKGFNSKHGGIKNDKMSKEDGIRFLDSINQIIKKFNNGAFYISFYRLGVGQYWTSLERVGLVVRSLIIWNKGNHTLSNSDYMSRYEPIFYGWVKDHNFYGGNNGMDIWDIKRTQKNDLHPTMKPVELIERAINNSSVIGNIIFDLFGGSGSTLIACEKLSRKCRMMEIDEHYCDVIIKRWEDFTGKKAELIKG